MENDDYFDRLSKKFDEINMVAAEARSKGYDPELVVEIKAAPDLAARVEGIIGIEGLGDSIRTRMKEAPDATRQALSFSVVKEICTNHKFDMEVQKRLTLATRAGLSILTEGVLVAPTEGLQGIELHKNYDGTDYISVLYAGPIRGAGGTSAALSVALADYSRQFFNIGVYRPTPSEVERCIEEMLLYHSKKARLQYLPSEQDMRTIIESCPVCVDGVPTEDIEVGTHRNVKRLDAAGKEQIMTNKIRGGIGLVICEGIAQKAKSVMKHTKAAGLDWSWLANVIPANKTTGVAQAKEEKNVAVFLQEMVAGRPVLAYPEYPGSFRLRYGRSRMTGIAAKGFSPATMYILDEFIATGTQMRIEKPGKGCIATPVDSIEGPFVKLKSGEAFRVNGIDQAKAVASQISKILSVGDMLVTYGDFKKTNTPLAPTSYVEEYWEGQLRAAGFGGTIEVPSFKAAFELSNAYGVPMHPRFIYDYSDVRAEQIRRIAEAVLCADLEASGNSLFDIASVSMKAPDTEFREAFERLCIPHFDDGTYIKVSNDDAQSLVASLGFAREGMVHLDAKVLERYAGDGGLDIVNSVAPFRIMKRATRVGGRIGRPEKAKERLMKPAPNVLFPIGEHGGKERNVYKSYMNDKRKFGNVSVDLVIARYRCKMGGELIISPYCRTHGARGYLERVCKICGRMTTSSACPVCKSRTDGYDIRKVNLSEAIDNAMKNVGIQTLPKAFKGVKGLVSADKISEPLEKGILRGNRGVNIFKDGTARFDATDAPMTHFYPKEIGTSVGRLRELGYTHDYLGNELERDDQLVEMRHQDVVINRRGGDYMLRVARFVDDLLERFYRLKPFYNISEIDGLVGHCVITLSPHTSCGVLGRIIGFTNASVGFAHPYTITARRRNCDGDEDTLMLALDALLNFSKKYLPVTIGGTMDAPLIMTLHVIPEEVDDEVHDMEVVDSYGLEFYNKTLTMAAPSDAKLELVRGRLGKAEAYFKLGFTHATGPSAVDDAPYRSMYTKLKTMQEKIDMQFSLMDKLYTINKADTARRLIMSHFIPDLMGNLHSFSRQTFRCVSCNAKYRRVPLEGKCTRERCGGGKLVLTISKGGIEKYLNVAIALSDRYDLEPYIKQRILLLKDEIQAVFGNVGGGEKPVGQFNLANYV